MNDSPMRTARRAHDRAVWLAWNALLDDGYRVAMEVGVPRGRIDIVRLDDRDGWAELYEVKLRSPEDGLSQLRRYALRVEGDPLLTLVVPPDLATPDLSAASAEAGVRLWLFAGWQVPLWRRKRGECVHLPYIHPSVTQAMSWPASVRERARWIERQKAGVAA